MKCRAVDRDAYLENDRARHLGGAARFREVKNLNHYARILMAGYRERVTLISSAHLNGLEVHA